MTTIFLVAFLFHGVGNPVAGEALFQDATASQVNFCRAAVVLTHRCELGSSVPSREAAVQACVSNMSSCFEPKDFWQHATLTVNDMTCLDLDSLIERVSGKDPCSGVQSF
jgi:hypothetical protein